MREGKKSGKSTRDKLPIFRNGAIFCGRPKMTKVIYFLWTGGVLFYTRFN